MERLLRPEQFEAVLAGGDVLRRRPVVVRIRPNGLEYARLGIIASRKAMPRAVDRNRSKRLVREAFRAARGALPALDIIVQFRSLGSRARAVTWAEVKDLFTTLCK